VALNQRPLNAAATESQNAAKCFEASACSSDRRASGLTSPIFDR